MKSTHATDKPSVASKQPNHNPLVGELMDLYIAMIIVIPVAFFLKSLWP